MCFTTKLGGVGEVAWFSSHVQTLVPILQIPISRAYVSWKPFPLTFFQDFCLTHY